MTLINPTLSQMKWSSFISVSITKTAHWEHFIWIHAVFLALSAKFVTFHHVQSFYLEACKTDENVKGRETPKGGNYERSWKFGLIRLRDSYLVSAPIPRLKLDTYGVSVSKSKASMYTSKYKHLALEGPLEGKKNLGTLQYYNNTNGSIQQKYQQKRRLENILFNLLDIAPITDCIPCREIKQKKACQNPLAFRRWGSWIRKKLWSKNGLKRRDPWTIK